MGVCLIQVQSEYQLQSVERFICGLGDPELQRKLRFHCQRDKMTIDHAYQYAVDYESSKVTGEGDLVAAAAACAHVSTLSSMAAAQYPSRIRPPQQSHPRSDAACFIQTIAEVDQVERNAVAIEELKAGQRNWRKVSCFSNNRWKKSPRNFALTWKVSLIIWRLSL